MLRNFWVLFKFLILINLYAIPCKAQGQLNCPVGTAPVASTVVNINNTKAAALCIDNFGNTFQGRSQIINVVFAGDSQTNGSTSGSLPLTNPITTYSSFIFATNKGIVGDTCSNMISEGPTVIDTSLVTGAINVLHIWCGTNDFAISGNTVATVIANLKAYAIARRAAGWNRIIVCTMISRAGTNPVGGETLDTDAINFSAQLRSVYTTFADALVDLQNNNNLGCAGCSATACVDGVHPSAASVNQYIAPLSYNAILTVTQVHRLTGIAVAHITSGGGLNLTSAGTGGMNVTPGNLIACHYRYPTGFNVSSIVDTATNTFVQLPSSNASGITVQWAYAKNILGNTIDVVTLTLSGSASAMDIFCWELSGVDKINPFDTQSFTNGTTVTSLTSSSFTTTTINEIVLATLDSNGVNTVFTAGTNYIQDGAGYPVGAGNLFSGAEHQILSNQSSITASMSQNQSATLLLHAITFRPAAL